VLVISKANQLDIIELPFPAFSSPPFALLIPLFS